MYGRLAHLYPLSPFRLQMRTHFPKRAYCGMGETCPPRTAFYIWYFFRFLFCLRRVFSGPQIFAERMNGEKCNKIEWIQKCLIQTYVIGSLLPHWALAGQALFSFAFVLFGALIFSKFKNWPVELANRHQKLFIFSTFSNEIHNPSQSFSETFYSTWKQTRFMIFFLLLRAFSQSYF